MSRNVVFITCTVVAGIAVVRTLFPIGVGTVAEIGAVCAAISAVIVRIDTRTQPPASASAKASVLLLLDLPEQPLAKVKEGWALT